MNQSNEIISHVSDLPPLESGEKVSGTMVNIYAATCNEDSTEGRGRQIDNSYHTTLKAAWIACTGIGVMGGDGDVVERLALNLDDGRYFLLQNQSLPIAVSASEDDARAAANLRVKALAKLSPAERAALGL